MKVVLDGQGGDELLAGYARFVLPVRARPRCAGPGRARARRASCPTWAGSRAAAASGSSRGRRSRPRQRALGLPPWVRRARRCGATSRAPRPRARGRERPYRSALNNALWNELRREGLPEVLHAEDALSMAFSVESRTPFLDHRLVELCFSLPYTDKIADGWTKSLLRRALADEMPRGDPRAAAQARLPGAGRRVAPARRHVAARCASCCSTARTPRPRHLRPPPPGARADARTSAARRCTRAHRTGRVWALDHARAVVPAVRRRRAVVTP